MALNGKGKIAAQSSLTAAEPSKLSLRTTEAIPDVKQQAILSLDRVGGSQTVFLARRHYLQIVDIGDHHRVG